MAREEIIHKLSVFFTAHPVPTEECHVVYLMISIRKILEHEKGEDFLLLRFYCDWLAHTQKDRITNEIRQIMTDVYDTAVSEIANPSTQVAGSPVMQFAYMENLKQEMNRFFTDRSITTDLTDKGWLQFIGMLVKVLENQPINKPTDTIDSFSFVPAADQCVRGTLVFHEPVGGYPSYNFSNYYGL